MLLHYDTFERLIMRLQVQSYLQNYLGCVANLIFEADEAKYVLVDGDSGWQAMVKFVQVSAFYKSCCLVIALMLLAFYKVLFVVF